MFELLTPTKSKLLDVSILSQKNRPEDANPGAALSFSMELPNTALTMFDSAMREAFYTSAETAGSAQQELDGVDEISDLPFLTPMGRHIGPVRWELTLTDYELTFDYGLGAASNLVLKECTVDDISFSLKEGGTVILKLKTESIDMTGADFGRLAALKSRDVHIMLKAPVIEQAPLPLTEADVFTHQPGDPEYV